MKERGLSVAVASSKNSPFVFSVLPYDDESDFGDAIFARSVDIERQEDESHGEYIAAMAGRARAKSGASVGAAISNVFRNDDENSKHFMLICIADENKARVFKVFSRKGETTQELSTPASTGSIPRSPTMRATALSCTMSATMRQ